MRIELADSLRYISSALAAQTGDAEVLQKLPCLDNLADSLIKHENKKVPPAVFGYYYRLVFLLLAGEETGKISRYISRLTGSFETVSNLVIKNLDVTALGSEDCVSMYRQCFDTDEGTTYGFLPPEHHDGLRVRAAVTEALDLMQKSVPDLYGETTAIISEILLASAPKTENAPRFDGASSYQLWGAVVLNSDNDKSVIEMLETLAHECSHCFLFGLTVDEPLVLNDENERYQSPLREDPRPMDGIYHATFVSARMHYALVEAMQSELLSDAQREECNVHLAASRKAFYDGYEVVSARAKYSDTGREIMQNAHEYMQQAGPSTAVA